MRARGALWWAFLGVLLLAACQSQGAPAQTEGVGSPAALAAEEREACRRNLRVIYDAIQAYQFDHKDLPNWLSDLVPDYLSDGNVLICPVCRRTGRTEAPPLADPKLACSYIFDFCPVPVGSAEPGKPQHTRREWKRRQMGLVGSAVPIVRCRHHSPVLNLGFNGTIYDSPNQWELLFTNRIRATELSVAAIFGQESPQDSSEPSRPPALAGSKAALNGSKRFIDLSLFYTSKLNQPWFPGGTEDLGALATGPQQLGGVDFDIQGVVQLKGKAPVTFKYPARVNGIPVHQRCQHLYFLHAAYVSGTVKDGAQIGSYVIHPLDSSMTLDIPIIYGSSLRSWHPESGEKLDPDLHAVWTDTTVSESSKAKRLFMISWNLSPGMEIDTIDFKSAEGNAAPFLLAISYD